MAWNKEGRRVYGRVYMAALRAGCDRAIARLKAQRAMYQEAGQVTMPRRTVQRRPQRIVLPKTKLSECEGTAPKHDSVGDRVRVPPDVLLEAERIRFLDHPTQTAAFFGDPLPGRSALDRMTAEDRARFT